MPKGIFLHKQRSEKEKLNIKTGQCKHHNKPVNDIERFWSYVDIKGLWDCWDWQGRVDKNGYSKSKYNGKYISSHRLAYKLYYGEIPKNKMVCHKCNNGKCRNPFHLYAGTQQDNTNDMVNAGRQARGEIHGSSKLTEKQVLEIRENKDKLSQGKLAKIYHVTTANISRIKQRKSWKYLDRGQING